MASEAGNWLKNIVGLLAKLDTTAQERRRNWKFDSSQFVITDNPGQDCLEFTLAGAGVVPTTGAANTVLQSTGSAAAWNAALQLGSAPATEGDVRLSAAARIVFRYSSTNYSLVASNNADAVLGGPYPTRPNLAVVDGATQSVLQVGGNDVLRASASLIAACQDLRLDASKSVDCRTNGAFLKPRYTEQSGVINPDLDELMVQKDTSGGPAWYLVVKTADGTKKAALT